MHMYYPSGSVGEESGHGFSLILVYSDSHQAKIKVSVMAMIWCKA